MCHEEETPVSPVGSTHSGFASMGPSMRHVLKKKSINSRKIPAKPAYL